MANLILKYCCFSQVISKSVADALRCQGKFDTKSTIEFVELFDRAFDCLNVTRVDLNDKPDRRPYYSINDERFEVLWKVLLWLHICQPLFYRKFLKVYLISKLVGEHF